MSNLRLAAREARGNPLPAYFAAQRAAESIGKKSESLILVRDGRIELPVSVWKTEVLPLHQSRLLLNYNVSFFRIQD